VSRYSEAVRRHQATAVDEILARRPLRLPMCINTGESIIMYHSLGVRMPGWRRVGWMSSALVDAYFPSTWTIHRTSLRWIEIRDEAETPILTAFYKFTDYDNKAFMSLTQDALDRLRSRWASTPRWRRSWQQLWTDPADREWERYWEWLRTPKTPG
jgi:hypothetical protein